MDKGRREKGSAAGFTVGRFTVQRLFNSRVTSPQLSTGRSPGGTASHIEEGVPQCGGGRRAATSLDLDGQVTTSDMSDRTTGEGQARL